MFPEPDEPIPLSARPEPVATIQHTWESLTPTFMLLLEHGETEDAKAFVREQFLAMARDADAARFNRRRSK